MKDDVLPGQWHIPAGTTLLLSIGPMMRCNGWCKQSSWVSAIARTKNELFRIFVCLHTYLNEVVLTITVKTTVL